MPDLSPQSKVGVRVGKNVGYACSPVFLLERAISKLLGVWIQMGF